jgi:hypothetical protein
MIKKWSDWLLEKFDRQKGLCFWCLQPMTHPDDRSPKAKGKDPTKEHLVDAVGGSERKGGIENIVITHRRCNWLRNNVRTYMVQHKYEKVVREVNGIFHQDWKKECARVARDEHVSR